MSTVGNIERRNVIGHGEASGVEVVLLGTYD